MTDTTPLRLQLVVFSLVSASFASIYLTQPVLPILQTEFQVDMVIASISVSAVILGMAISNLPFGYLADRFSIRPILLAGGICIAGRFENVNFDSV
jgi:MFS transporter, YNFM family, putative membrane transport protein